MMPDSENKKTYEDLKNSKSIQSDANLENLIKAIEKIKDVTSNDDDKIGGDFIEASGGGLETLLNQGLLDSLNKQDLGTLEILFGEIKKINEDKNLNLNEDMKNSVDNLLKAFTQLFNGKRGVESVILESDNNVDGTNVNWESKDRYLTPEQLENIRIIRDELGINVDFGIDVGYYSIDEIKDIKLTNEQIKNIKALKSEFGIDVDCYNIDEIKDIKLTNEQMKYIKDLGVELNAREIEPILNNFDILSVNSENFYKGYGYTKYEIKSHYYYKRGRIVENIQSYIQNFISKNRDVWEVEVIKNIRSDLITLPIEERLKILGGINKIVKKFNTIRKYLDFKNGPYKTPKDLLCAMRGISDPNIIAKISNDITVKQHGTGITFFIGDKGSYQIIDDTSLVDSGARSSGFNTSFSKIKQLEGTLSVINGKDPGENIEDYNYGTVWHEGQHNRNSYFMPDNDSWRPIALVKNEITAFLREGNTINNIESILTKPGLYQYELEGIARENHKEEVRELLGYANDLIDLTKNPETGLTRDKIISMLSDTPIEKRKELHDNIMKAIKDGNTVEKLWRNGSAEKEAEIEEINLANIVEDAIHTLRNPKYSHILRGQGIPGADIKGGIEVAAIINDVLKKAKKGSEYVSDVDFRGIIYDIRPKVGALIIKSVPKNDREAIKEKLIKSFANEEQMTKRIEIEWFLNK